MPAILPFGVVGLETAFGVAMTEMVETGAMTLADLVDRMACAPARIMGLPGGRLEAGAPADLVVLDPAERWTVDPDRFLSRSRNTPFAGRELVGRVRRTVVAGVPRFAADGAESPGAA